MRKRTIFALAAGASLAAAGQSQIATGSATSAAPKASGGLQQAFDAATKSFEAGNWADAVAAYAALETKLPKTATRSQAVVLTRKGYALYRAGKIDQAAPALEAGLALIPADPALAADRALANGALATFYEQRLWYSLARRHYRRAIAETEISNEKLHLMAGLARTLMFEDPIAAAALADDGLELSARLDAPTETRAAFMILQGRALLNSKKYGQAFQHLATATDRLGGLTRKVGQADLQARSDLGIAAILYGNEANAHKYFAYTGIGLGEQGNVPAPSSSGWMACHGSMTPDDMVIAEFAIDDAGRVKDPHPIYASRSGTLATDMTDVLLGWKWTPEQIKTVSPLLRSVVRVELRCAKSDIDDPTIDAAGRALDRWLQDIKIPPFEPGKTIDEEAREQLARAELARREAASGKNAPALLPVLELLRKNAFVGSNETEAITRRILTIAQDAKAPPDAIAEASANLIGIQDRARNYEARLMQLRQLTERAPVLGNPEATALVQLKMADLLRSLDRWDEYDVLLTRLGANAALPSTSPYRRAAHAKLYEYYSAQRDTEEKSRAALAAAGVSANPCSLFESRQPMRVLNRGFPSDAQRWGFEGWTRSRVDLAADGSVRHPQVTIAYPPLVFSDATRALLGKYRFDTGKDVQAAGGCTGKSTSIKFGYPD